ncbi:hypothetical protein AHF37_01376 [Paragonimus kellicotti]|nr:hypothetical protein AHF37_01376 [Paragonimus kellicotti]
MYVYPINGEQIVRIRQAKWGNADCRSPNFSNRYGQFTWECAKALSTYIVNNIYLVEGRHILELGAGTGLCGLVAGRCGASSVTFSDNDVQIHTYLLRNATINKIAQCNFLLLDWNYPTRNWQRQTFDVILAADTLFDKEVYEPFFRTLSLLLHSNPDAFCLLSVETRSTLTSIPVLMKKYFLQCLPESNPGSRFHSVQIYRVRAKSSIQAV